MSGITTHVLDTARGRPAPGIEVTLERLVDGRWEIAGRGRTDQDGRVRTLLSSDPPPAPGVYRLTFDTGPYFKTLGTPAFYPNVTVTFEAAGDGHYHVPLLLSPYGYSTYRGS
jgi:5-hydroxyisourate hydrolase